MSKLDIIFIVIGITFLYIIIYVLLWCICNSCNVQIDVLIITFISILNANNIAVVLYINHKINKKIDKIIKNNENNKKVKDGGITVKI